MCGLSDIVTEWQPFGRSKPLRVFRHKRKLSWLLFALKKLFCLKRSPQIFRVPWMRMKQAFGPPLKSTRRRKESDLPHALFRCVIHDGPMSGEFKKMEHLAPNEALKSYHLTCVGMRREFLRLWTNFSGGEPPEDIAWNSATALAWVYPEGIRLVKDRDYYCYGPFSQGDTLSPSTGDSVQLLLGMREIQDKETVYFGASMNAIHDDTMIHSPLVNICFLLHQCTVEFLFSGSPSRVSVGFSSRFWGGWLIIVLLTLFNLVDLVVNLF